ncbi:MAG: high light inducible protein [Cyanobacteria bacterium CRU_2_1]|nr:high light inducible protein [Cyanobacteria bacterium RU_5_0]NJR59110.1 high light inducible protein [Cyanobacteria bacterium CRU_2_1]
MENQQPKFGFTQFAETWNGRLAMIGFVVGLATEFLTGQGILSQLGLM